MNYLAFKLPKLTR